MIEKMITKSGRMLKENGEFVNIADLTEETLGGKGFEFIADTAEHAAPEGMVYIALQVVDEAELSSFESDGAATVIGTFTGEPLPVGDVTYGRFKKITLSGGKIKAYLGV